MFKYFVGALVALVVPFTSYASSEVSSSAVSCPDEVDELFKPLSQKVVLAMFGKSASVSALSYRDLTDQQADAIEGLTYDEVSACASPMPAYTSTTVISILNYLYFVTAVIWIVMIVAYAFDSSYLSMGRNNDRDAAEEGPLLKIVRAAIAMMFTAPLISILVGFTDDEGGSSGSQNAGESYSAIHKLMFTAIGKSIGASEAIDESLKQKFISSNPIYTLPEPAYALKGSSFRLLSDVGTGAMMNFATCLVANNKNRAVNVNDIVITDASTNSGFISKELTYNNPDSDCYIKIEMPSDQATIMKANMLIQNHEYDLIDYQRLEKETYAYLVNSLLDLSLGMATGLASHLDSETQLVFSSATLNEDINNLKFWTEACPTSYSEALNFGKNYALDSEGKLTESSYIAYQALAERCLSYAIVTKLGYPKHPSGDMITDPQSRFGNTLYKFDASLLTEIDENGNNIFVFPELDYMRKLEGRQFQACSYASNSVDDNIKSCTEQVCKLANANDHVSGMFECGVMINKANANGLTKFYSDLGFIATPATLMSSLGGSSVPPAPQMTLKNFSMSSDFSIDESVIGDRFYKQIVKVKNEDGILVTLPTFTSTDYKIETASYDQHAYSDVLTCLINPSSVIEKGTHQVICEHPLNEIHDSGIFMLKMFASYAAGVTGRQITPFASKMIKKRSDINKGKPKSDGGVTDDIDAEILPTSNSVERGDDSRKSTKGFKKVLDVISPYVGAGILSFVFPLVLDGKVFTPPNFIMGMMMDVDDNPYWNDSRGNLSGMGIMAGLTLGYMVSGNIKLGNADKITKEEEAAIDKKAKNVTLIGSMILIVGFVAAFIIPLMPLAIFYAAFFSVLANILANVLSANFQVIYALANTGKDVRKKLTSMFNKWLLLVLRLPLLVVGFYMSMSLMLTILPDFALAMTEIVDRADLSGIAIEELLGVVKWILGLVLFLAMYMLLMFALMDGITAPFNLTRGLIFNDDSGQVMGTEDTHSKLNKNIQLFKNL
ncbi:hypothetical protein OTK49_01320 [Vibrio coralliirubri]|uniref:hypothetical protein n=1 Tax=Vibrio coralliirubri TaxID=1516159 RepID=UPI002283AEA6|nr:hypothetical protein [Vibrio coralliirubri]MCY9861169.1 hypothetical protein [Vibrio coralliirubri]